MPKKDERRCRHARIGAAIAGGFFGGAAGPTIGAAFPDRFAVAVTIVSAVLCLIGGIFTASGTADACSDDDPGKKNEKSARIGFVILGIPSGAYIAVIVLKVAEVSGYTFEIALAGALAGAFAGDLISRRFRASV